MIFFRLCERKCNRVLLSVCRKREAPKGVVFFFAVANGSRTHLNADVRWTSAATSLKTGGYYDFLSPLRKKMQSSPVVSTARRAAQPIIRNVSGVLDGRLCEGNHGQYRICIRWICAYPNSRAYNHIHHSSSQHRDVLRCPDNPFLGCRVLESFR